MGKKTEQRWICKKQAKTSTDGSHLSWGHRVQCLHRRLNTQPTPLAGRPQTVGKQNQDLNKTYLQFMKAHSLRSTPLLFIFYMCEHTASILRPPVIQFALQPPATAGGGEGGERKREERNNESCFKSTRELPLISYSFDPPPLVFSNRFIILLRLILGSVPVWTRHVRRVDKNKT